MLSFQSSDGGCFSSVGYQNRTQVVNLKNFNPGEGCFRLGTIMHEFLHGTDCLLSKEHLFWNHRFE